MPNTNAFKQVSRPHRSDEEAILALANMAAYSEVTFINENEAHEQVIIQAITLQYLPRSAQSPNGLTLKLLFRTKKLAEELSEVLEENPYFISCSPYSEANEAGDVSYAVAIPVGLMTTLRLNKMYDYLISEYELDEASINRIRSCAREGLPVEVEKARSEIQLTLRNALSDQVASNIANTKDAKIARLSAISFADLLSLADTYDHGEALAQNSAKFELARLLLHAGLRMDASDIYQAIFNSNPRDFYEYNLARDQFMDLSMTQNESISDWELALKAALKMGALERIPVITAMLLDPEADVQTLFGSDEITFADLKFTLKLFKNNRDLNDRKGSLKAENRALKAKLPNVFSVPQETQANHVAVALSVSEDPDDDGKHMAENRVLHPASDPSLELALRLSQIEFGSPQASDPKKPVKSRANTFKQVSKPGRSDEEAIHELQQPKHYIEVQFINQNEAATPTGIHSLTVENRPCSKESPEIKLNVKFNSKKLAETLGDILSRKPYFLEEHLCSMTENGEEMYWIVIPTGTLSRSRLEAIYEYLMNEYSLDEASLTQIRACAGSLPAAIEDARSAIQTTLREVLSAQQEESLSAVDAKEGAEVSLLQDGYEALLCLAQNYDEQEGLSQHFATFYLATLLRDNHFSEQAAAVYGIPVSSEEASSYESQLSAEALLNIQMTKPVLDIEGLELAFSAASESSIYSAFPEICSRLMESHALHPTRWFVAEDFNFNSGDYDENLDMVVRFMCKICAYYRKLRDETAVLAEENRTLKEMVMAQEQAVVASDVSSNSSASSSSSSSSSALSASASASRAIAYYCASSFSSSSSSSSADGSAPMVFSRVAAAVVSHTSVDDRVASVPIEETQGHVAQDVAPNVVNEDIRRANDNLLS